MSGEVEGTPSTCEVHRNATIDRGVNTDDGAFGRSFGVHVGAMSFAATSSASLASLVAAFASTARVANFVTVLLMLLFIMFSGALVSSKGMPGSVSWIISINPFAYAFELISIGQFQSQCLVFNPTTMPALFDDTTDGTGLPCVEISGFQWLLQFGCTPAAHFNHTDDFPHNAHLDHCYYDYNTMHLDVVMGLLVTGAYTVLAAFAYGCWVREQR